MKALDTPILLRLLRGDPRTAAFLRKISAEELATTTINLFELEVIARTDPSPGRERRLAALERLRRKLTILPVDETAAVEAANALGRVGPHSPNASACLIAGALVAGRCSEWITAKDVEFPTPSGVKVTVLSEHNPKKAKSRI